MDKFRELSTFVTVAEEKAFNRAARKLSMSPSVVTRLVNALEDRIGAKLFTRTTRHVSLTEAGERLYHEADRILSALDEAEALASGAYQNPQGILNITAPVEFGQKYIVPILCDFLDKYPDVSIKSTFLDRTVHLIEEGYDLAIRIGNLPDSSFYAKKVGKIKLIIAASPEYLKENGQPQKPEDLQKHQIINTPPRNTEDEWLFQKNGITSKYPLSPRLSVNTISSAINAARSGWGIIRALSYQISEEIKNGELIEILQDYDDRELPIQIVYPESIRMPAKTRAFIDFASEILQKETRKMTAAK